MKSIEEILADNLKKRRTTLRLSQVELAKKAKVSMHTINRAEKKKLIPQKANLESIASVLGCTRLDLLTAESDIKTPPSIESLLSALTELQKENAALKAQSLTLPEQQLLELYRLAPPFMKQNVIENLNFVKGKSMEQVVSETPNMVERLIVKKKKDQA